MRNLYGRLGQSGFELKSGFVTRPPNIDGHARPGVFIAGERIRSMLASIDKKVTEAFSLAVGQNSKTLGCCYLADGIRHTMPTVMTEFA